MDGSRYHVGHGITLARFHYLFWPLLAQKEVCVSVCVSGGGRRDEGGTC